MDTLRTITIAFIFVFLASIALENGSGSSARALAQTPQLPVQSEQATGTSDTFRLDQFMRGGRTPNVESAETPEVQRASPVGTEPAIRIQTQQTQTEAVSTQTAVGEMLGPNLIPNANLESSAGSGRPVDWFKGGYGDNDRVLTYPVSGNGSGSAIEVKMSSRVSGDAKWFFSHVPVTAGATYEFSDYVKSTVPSVITVQFKKKDGTFTYKDIAFPPARASFTKETVRFDVPADIQSLTVFHLLIQPGILVTDDYSLREVTTETPVGENLMPNPEFETAGAGGNPAEWQRGGWGDNTRTFSYPVTGANSSKAAQVTVTNHVSGDAKWYHDFIPVSAGDVYTYADQYKATVPSIITAQFEHTNGSFSYKDLAILSSTGSFTPTSIDFTVPAGAVGVRIFHLINGNGTLAIDNVSLVHNDSPTSGVFSTGAVSLTFDDGWRAHHDVVMPKLQSAGMPGTFYIISQQLRENGFIGFVNKDEVRALFAAGNEIGAHTRTHRALTQLSASEQQTEINGSREDLETLGVGPVTTFAYPFGDYNGSVLGFVEDAQYGAARSTLDGNVTPTAQIYELPRFSVESDTTFTKVKQAVDAAIANKQWIILVFHRIDSSGERYSTTPALFNQIVDYLAANDIPVVTVAEGISDLQ